MKVFRFAGRNVLLVALVLLAVTGVAQASTFYWPPESNVPGWSSPFPYPRNIEWTFTTNPDGGPSSNGAPGAHYEGWLDPTLWDSDFVELTDAVQWFEDGRIGIDNTVEPYNGTYGQAIFHIDNTTDPFLKNIWLEFDAWANVPLGLHVEAPPESQVKWKIVKSENLPDGGKHYGFSFTIDPNPLWEEIRFDFSDVFVGSFVFLDNVHVATECVPEPLSMIFFGTGLAGVFGFVARKRIAQGT